MAFLPRLLQLTIFCNVYVSQCQPLVINYIINNLSESLLNCINIFLMWIHVLPCIHSFFFWQMIIVLMCPQFIIPQPFSMSFLIKVGLNSILLSLLSYFILMFLFVLHLLKIFLHQFFKFFYTLLIIYLIIFFFTWNGINIWIDFI